MTVTLKGFITVPKDRIGAVRTGLAEHIRLTRAEPGCISFDVTENPDVPGRFDVSEAFTDSEAFRAHQARASASDWARISEGLPRDYEVTGLDG